MTGIESIEAGSHKHLLDMLTQPHLTSNTASLSLHPNTRDTNITAFAHPPVLEHSVWLYFFIFMLEKHPIQIAQTAISFTEV